MEGGQKVPISLEAGLDISSSDMLVPFSQLTFQHNWQKWQGKCLPNSLRFEHDGWAAGWNVYDFKYNPYKKDFDGAFVGVEKLSSNMYMASVYDIDDIEMLKPLKDWRIVAESKILSGAAVLSNENTITGVIDSPSAHVNYELVWDSNAHKFNDLPAGSQFELKKFDVKDGIVYATVKDAFHSYNGSFALWTATPLTSKYSQDYKYTGYGNGGHSWDGYTFDGVGIVSPSGKTIPQGDIVNDGHMLKFHYTDTVEDGVDAYKKFLDYNDKRDTNDADGDEADRCFDDKELFSGEAYSISYSLERYYKAFNRISATDQSDNASNVLASDANKDLKINQYFVRPASANGLNSLTPGSRVLLDVKVPVWWSLIYTANGYKIYHHGVDRTDLYAIYDRTGYSNNSDMVRFKDSLNDRIDASSGHARMQKFYKGETGNETNITGNLSQYSYYVKPTKYLHIQNRTNSGISLYNPKGQWLDSADIYYFGGNAEIPRQPSGITYSEQPDMHAAPIEGEYWVSGTYGKHGTYGVFNAAVETKHLNREYGHDGQYSNISSSDAKGVIAGYVYGETNAVYNQPVLGASVVLEGHALFIIEYTKIANESKLLTSNSILTIRPAKEGDAEFDSFLNSHANEKLIMVDRDSLNSARPNVCCDRLFDFKITGKLIDDRNGDGYITVSPRPVGLNKTPFIYAVADSDDGTGSQNATYLKNTPYLADLAAVPFIGYTVDERYPNGVGDLYGGHDSDDDEGNVNADMGITDSRTAYASGSAIKLHWSPEWDEGPVSMNVVLNVNNKLGYKHDIYTKKLIALQNARCTLGGYSQQGGATADFGVVPVMIEIKRHDVDNQYLVITADYETGSKVLKNETYWRRVVDPITANKVDTKIDVNIDNGRKILYSGPEGVVEVTDIISKESRGFIPLKLTLNFVDCTAGYMAPADDHLQLVSSDGDNVKVKDTDDTSLSGVSKPELWYSTSRRIFLDNDTSADKVETEVSSDGQYKQIVDYSVEYAERFSAMLKAVFDGSMNGDVITLPYDSNNFELSLAELTAFDYNIDVVSVDIREPKVTKKLGSISPEGQLQLLKQAWNTTAEVENFWWVDRSHILELSSQYITLKRNTKRLHDWNGNIFEDVWKVPRSEIITGNVYRYFVPSAFEQSKTVFCTLEPSVRSVTLKIYDIRKQFKPVFECSIAPRHVNLGSELNADGNIEGNEIFLNTYSQLTAEMMLSKAEWSSTIVDDRLILGCHVSNNLNQWAIVVKLDDVNSVVEQVLQGYGYVGLHGELTGGMLPADYFDCNELTSPGFTGTVRSLKELDKDVNKDGDDKNVDKVFEVTSSYEISDIGQNIYGTAEQQWYVQKRLHGIVSHVLYVDDPKDDGNARQYSFKPEIVPITNNYEAMYASPSFYSSVIGDCMVQVSAFADLFKFPAGLGTVWRLLCGFVSYPLLYNFAPRFSSLCYLQQSFGQYAYVHYNSSRNPAVKELEDTENVKNGFESGKKDVLPVLSSEFVFDKQKVIQRGTTELDYFASGPIALLISSFSEALQIIGNKQSINEEQNQSAIFDTGKKYLENVAENTVNMLASAVMSQSKNDFGLTSTVTGLKSLDMFYSTADNQRVFAGPGYTEMQFVADCVAQSVTDTQVEGRVTQLFLNIKGLTTLQMELMLKIEGFIADLTDRLAEDVRQSTVLATNVGWAIAQGMHIVAQAIRFTMAAQQLGVNQVERVLDVLSSRGATASTDGHISRHALSVEGKHKYGEKNEVFMWPCWGVPAGQLKYSDESVACGVKNTPWELALHSAKYFTSSNTDWANIVVSCGAPNMSSNKANSTQLKHQANAADGKAGLASVGGDNYRAYRHEGSVPFYQIAPYGKVVERILPDDMAKIEGVSRFLPSVPFKNENIGVSDPAFAPSLIQDYILDKNWQLGLCSSYGLRQWVTLRDTKVLNGPPSNIVIDGEFCGIASPYTAIEVKRGIKKAYMRPLAITPNVLALNCTGYNTVYDDDLYHAFDGMSCRLVDLVGSPGLNKAKQSFYYAIQVNDRFKRSNIIPAQEMLGNFETEPVVAMDTIDQLWTTLTVAMDEKGLEAGTVGEDKDAVRWSIPVFSEPVSTLPACVKTMTAATLAVVEGVTGLVTAQVTDTNSAYKAPTSVDFSIGKNVYRATEEYICSVTPAEAGNVITDIVPSLGLKFIGSTPTEAYFYSKATRCYYIFTGSNLAKVDMMERFRDIQRGYWDFVNQEVVMPCLMTFKRLNPDIEDTDTETDNVIVPVLSKGTVSGELPPPLTTIFNDRSWYKCLSLPSGFAYQGPNRVIINRAVFTEYMLETMKENLGKWDKVPREKYSFNREYAEKYGLVTNSVGVAEDGRKHGVSGWTHNPFLLVTSALGVAENTDCLFEWEITFCWPVEMDLLYGPDNYACVNIMGETMTPGGKREARPTHVFLTKELFTRNGSYGYYSFRYQSKNGSGNRERLKIWSDSYIAVSSLTCECKVVTQRRSEQLTQQIDVRDLKEL